MSESANEVWMVKTTYLGKLMTLRSGAQSVIAHITATVTMCGDLKLKEPSVITLSSLARFEPFHWLLAVSHFLTLK
jgi:hypothetical protein